MLFLTLVATSLATTPYGTESPPPPVPQLVSVRNSSSARVRVGTLSPQPPDTRYSVGARRAATAVARQRTNEWYDSRVAVQPSNPTEETGNDQGARHVSFADSTLDIDTAIRSPARRLAPYDASELITLDLRPSHYVVESIDRYETDPQGTVSVFVRLRGETGTSPAIIPDLFRNCRTMLTTFCKTHRISMSALRKGRIAKSRSRSGSPAPSTASD